MNSEQLISIVKRAALGLSNIINEPNNKFTKDQIAKLMPITVEFMSAMSLATSKIASQETEITHLGRQLEKSEESKRSPDGSADSICQALAELNDRNARSKNVIVQNVPEADKILSLNDQNIEDRAKMEKMFENVAELQTIKPTKIFRLGMRKDEKMRPLKVIFEDSGEAAAVMSGRSRFPKGIKVKRDLTVMQRGELQRLWEEVDRRKRNGEDNITVKFINAKPKIVALPPKNLM